MKHKVSVITKSGELVPVREIICDGYEISAAHFGFSRVEFWQPTKRHWYSKVTKEIVASVLVEGQILVERA